CASSRTLPSAAAERTPLAQRQAILVGGRVGRAVNGCRAHRSSLPLQAATTTAPLALRQELFDRPGVTPARDGLQRHRTQGVLVPLAPHQLAVIVDRQR